MSIMRRRRLTSLALLVVVAGCGDPDPETTFVASAAGHEFTVEEEAGLMMSADSVPEARQAALSLANLWTDYILLATAAAEDSTFAQLELGPVVEGQAEQVMLAALRDSVIRADAAIPDAELRRRYDQVAEGSEIRARQIRIDVAPGAPAARHDSALEAIRELRARIVEDGEDFATLAREHSQDPGTAARGGDMGFFGTGDMVPPFEEAAFALEPGEVSEPVETRDGYHLIQLEERRTPTREQFRQRLQRQRSAQALNAYIEALEERASPDYSSNAAAVARQLAREPAGEGGEAGEAGEGEGAASDTLVRFEGGALTLRDVDAHLRDQPPQVRSRIASADPERLVEGLLRPLVRQQLLEREARRQGLEPSVADKERSAASIRQRLVEVTRQLGLLALPEAGDEETGQGAALDQAVSELLREMVRGEREVVRLGGALSQVLRAQYPTELRDDRTVLVARRLEELSSGEGSEQEEDR